MPIGGARVARRIAFPTEASSGLLASGPEQAPSGYDTGPLTRAG